MIANRHPVPIDKQMLDHFLMLSGDRNPLHTHSLGSKPVIPGNLLLCLLPQMVQSRLRLPADHQLYTVKYDKVRFKSPLTIDCNLNVSIKIQSTRSMMAGIYVTYKFDYFSGSSEVPSAMGQFSDCYVEA